MLGTLHQDLVKYIVIAVQLLNAMFSALLQVCAWVNLQAT